MSLRNPKTDELDKILGISNQTFKNLLEAIALASLGSEAIVALTNNKQDFDARKSEWLSKLALTHEPPHSSEYLLFNLPSLFLSPMPLLSLFLRSEVLCLLRLVSNCCKQRQN